MRKPKNTDNPNSTFWPDKLFLKSIKYACLLSAFLIVTVNTSIAQQTDPPVWMEHFAQGEIYDTGYVKSQLVLDPACISTVRITMAAEDYSYWINNTDNYVYLLADMTFENQNIPLKSIDQVGIRLRGAAARGSAKKSFKISFREFGNDLRDFHGLRKLNLNCDFQDPHLMRAKTCTDLFRYMGIPAARVGYSKLYINNEYRGLFANYEDIDKAFLQPRFRDDNGDLYKCDGATMQNGSGGYQLTTNELSSNHSDILEFINVLNNTNSDLFKEEIEKVFNVDEMLMYTACNVLLGAWDDYWMLAKNYYFYHDLRSDKFNYIPHDFDGSLGTDWYYGEIAYANVYDWSKNAGRPMIENLLAIPEYRDKYTHYLMLLCMWTFSLDAMESEIDRTADMIRGTLTTDPYWGWNPSDFDLAFDQAISQGSVKYGMKEYINLRRNSALEQLEKIGPYIKHVKRNPLLPKENDPVTIEHLVIDRENVVSVKLIYKEGSSFSQIDMLDSGTGHDETANDYVFTAQIPAQNKASTVMYCVEATNTSGKTSRYPAAGEWESYAVNYEPPAIVINEVMAKNDSVKADEYGEYDDWVELYNPVDTLVDLAGMYVSDNLYFPKKWSLGNISIPAKGFLLLWLDKDQEQGANHIGFKLSGNGESFGLFDTDDHQNLLIDGLQYGLQAADISLGRTQDGAEEWIFFANPTPGYGNTEQHREDQVDITNFGGAISESNNDSPNNESIINIIDNNTTTKYLTFNEATNIEYGLSDSSLVSGYAIVSANDASERDPSNWDFQAYDEENLNWVTLHSVRNEPEWLSRFTPKEFYFSNSKRYLSYRLSVSSAHGSGILQIAEIEIYGVIGNGPDVPDVPDAIEEHIAGEFTIYPNPARDILNIKGDIEMKGIAIFDLSGRMLKQLSMQPEFRSTLNISELTSGFYILQIETVSGRIVTSKI
ncbi:MAG: CotH kinase family protein, partial [Bacteroidales bacterium]|nr:CotH kinase family protein [Bacteroidales bacterium]